ncbi:MULTISPECIES: hypothetical protein [Streptomyces]|uniref:hypothetical protein n=1 Tax=Streptomyces TaxID=1883 RepID=UPI000E0637D7|nr:MULTISPECIES: hypothetical protein [Streptomyces]MBT3077627.1 hypothetical protein [Streptomyces sp. COG21]MBT3084473.1 hypothetical protein [Streptomyces sp. COG20]MBT3085380.1 hypothetical protein [Streptomyces sp. CYG21]MBT3098972.1 hypothetical protein [Streptomyces sp. CBG30]MBT3103578.1 hypothetical protein [Streptomyces sp. COG19]
MTDTPMTPDREQEIRERLASTLKPQKAEVAELLAEVDRLRKALSGAADQVAELDDTNAQLNQQVAAQRSTAKQLLGRVAELTAAPVGETVEMAAATTGAAYRSQPLPPRDAMCTCGHTGLDHHHSETSCWATLPRTQQRNGTWSAVPTCDCSEFEATP